MVAAQGSYPGRARLVSEILHHYKHHSYQVINVLSRKQRLWVNVRKEQCGKILKVLSNAAEVA